MIKISLTFDDGLRSQYIDFYPILKKYGLTATFYIDTVNINKKGRLTIEQIRELHREGHEIGSHCHHHRRLTRLSPKEIGEEFKKSKEILSEFNVRTLAYPFGDYNKEVMRIAKKHFQSARIYSRREINVKPYDLFALKTISFDQEELFSASMGFSSFKNYVKQLFDAYADKDCWITFTFHGRYILSPKDRLTQMRHGITLRGAVDFITKKLKNPSAMKKFDFFCHYIKRYKVMPVSRVLQLEKDR